MPRLGCLHHDPLRLARLPLMRFAAEMPAPKLPPASWQPAMWDNDTLPNCTAVALGNAGRGWVKRLSGDSDDLRIDVSCIDRLYATAIGVPGATKEQLAATEGADPLAVVETAQTRGFDVGGQVPLVPDFRVLAGGRIAAAQAMARSGAVMLAVTLYAADMDAAAAGRPWEVGGDPGPAVGDHMVAAVSYDGLADSGHLQIATWGAWQRASWAWLRARRRLGVVTGWRQLTPPEEVANYDAIWSAAA